MTLNCRAGDIAVVAQAEPACKPLIGNVVKVEHTVEHHGKTVWLIEDFVDLTFPMDAHDGHRQFKAGQTVKISGIPDAWLVPILDTKALRRYVRQG